MRTRMELLHTIERAEGEAAARDALRLVDSPRWAEQVAQDRRVAEDRDGGHHRLDERIVSA